MKLLAAALFLVTCQTPGPIVPKNNACAQACSNMTELGCPGHEGSPGQDGIEGNEDDVACAQVCEDFYTEGFDFHADCVSAADSCDSVDTCSLEEQ